MKQLIMGAACVVLGGCALLEPRNPPFESEPVAAAPEAENTEDLVRPQARPEAETAGEEEAVVAPDIPAGALGRTVASLGDASEAGLWLKTPLVKTQRAGQVRYPQTGKTVAVTLIPIDGPATAGSRISLQAMQALGVPLTALAEVDVSAG